MPSISPGAMLKLTPSTTAVRRAPVTVRSCTSNSGEAADALEIVLPA